MRRFFLLGFALPLFLLALSVPWPTRSSVPPDNAIATISTLILPHVAAAQTRDTLGGAPVARAAPAPSADSVVTPANHSHAILISTLVLIVIVCFVAWLINRKDKGARYESPGTYNDTSERSPPHGKGSRSS